MEKHIKGVKEINGFYFEDKRGKIHELIGFPVVSITHTISVPRSLRGLHVQLWDKVIYVASGSIYTILVDARKNSPTYKVKEEFLMDSQKAYFIPKGVANSYCVIGNKPVNYFYFNSEKYNEKKTFGINYNLFSYPVKNPIVSEKDRNLPYEY